VGGEIFRTCPDRPWGPPSLLCDGYRVFPGGKDRPGCDADPSPTSSAMVKKEQSYTSTPPMGCTACTEPHCLYRGALYHFYLYVAYAVTTAWMGWRVVVHITLCTSSCNCKYVKVWQEWEERQILIWHLFKYPFFVIFPSELNLMFIFCRYKVN